jgi:segregation and condensation protein A
MADYRVQLQVFEGPLDLLLYLIKKEEVDIYEVNLTKIATQFIEHVELMRRLDLEVAGEFLVMAATLVYLKSRELLPVEQQAPDTDEEDDHLDPRWELIRQLVEYKKFKEVAGSLQEREIRQEAIFPHFPGRLDLPPVADSSKPKVSLLDLLNAVNVILKRLPEESDFPEIHAERWSVSDKIAQLVRLLQDSPRLKFTDLFRDASTRVEVVTVFLALLELVRLKQAAVAQSDPFGEIEINRAPANVAAPAADTGTERSSALTVPPPVPRAIAPTPADTERFPIPDQSSEASPEPPEPSP